MITQKNVNKYLEVARSLKRENLFFDMHAHPFEVIYATPKYHPHPERRGLFTTGHSDFTPPSISSLTINTSEENLPVVTKSYSSPITRLMLSALYSHTGMEVFNAQMAASGIDRTLLLPVAPSEGSVEQQMLAMEKMFPDRNKYCFGWSVSNNLENEEILSAAKNAVERFNIEAIKIHPNKTEINLTARAGKQRLEYILNVCNQLRLPLVIHTGKCPYAENPEANGYSTIDVLKEINWEMTIHPIVFAHAASYCCEVIEMENHILPQLKKLLAKYDHVFMDISGLDVHGLALLFKSIPMEKLLFGSDSLYEAQWQTVVKLLYALEKVSEFFEEDFLKIISTNPEKFIFGYALRTE